MNFVIDNVLVIVVAAIVALVMTLAGQDASETGSTMVALGSMLGYYVGLEALFGWTIGKLVTGTRVVGPDGRKPGLSQIVGRTFVRFLPFEPFSVLFGHAGRGWHDSMSNTRVVRVRR